MMTLWNDIRYGFRQLVKHPGFTVAVVLTLSIGIGANTALFSIVNPVLLRPLPYKNPDQLVSLHQTNPRIGPWRLSTPYGAYMDWRDQNHVFDRIVAYQLSGFDMRDGEDVRHVSARQVTSEFFLLLGARPILGRCFVPEDEELYAPRVVVLDYRFWQEHFKGETNVIGQSIVLGQRSYTTVGVLPPQFRFPPSGRAEVYVPFVPDPEIINERGGGSLEVVARLRKGIGIEQAQVDMTTIAKRLEQQYPFENAGYGISIEPLEAQYNRATSQIRPVLVLLSCIVGFVLLLACANVANLLFTRVVARRKEIAIRCALGAGRVRIMRQLFVENVMLSILGGGLGLLGATVTIRLFHLLRPIKVTIPRLDEIGIDGQVLCFTMGLSVLTALLFGCFPAIRASKADIGGSLKAADRTLAVDLSQQRTQHLLVIIESALASMLLVGAGLLINSFRLLQSVDPGFNTDGVLVMDVWPSVPRAEMPRATVFYSEVLTHIRALPGIQFADATNSSPLSGNNEEVYFNERGLRAADREDRIHVQKRRIFSDYFRVVQIPLLRGRYFSERDTELSAPVAIINEAMARRFWPGEDPIGKRIPEEIVGVVGDVKHHGLASSAVPELYVPYRQNPNLYMQLVVRVDGNPDDLTRTIRSEILMVDRTARVANITTLERRISDSISAQRFTASVSGCFGFVAAVLVTIGVYGIMAYFVSLRTHEIGIRIAVGAQASEVLMMVIKHGLWLVFIGLGIGLLGALALCRFISGLLYGIGPTDIQTFGGASLLLVGVTFAACYVPARRAAKIDPMVALRYE